MPKMRVKSADLDRTPRLAFSNLTMTVTTMDKNQLINDEHIICGSVNPATPRDVGNTTYCMINGIKYLAEKNIKNRVKKRLVFYRVKLLKKNKNSALSAMFLFFFQHFLV